MVVFALVLSLAGCEYFDKKPHEWESSNDSVSVAKLFKQQESPEFSTLRDVVDYQNARLEKAYCDSVFLHLSEETLNNVCSVILKSGRPLDVKAIINEYEHNKGVYDKLPPNTCIGVATPTDTVSQYTSYRSHDTVINGKQAKITEKIEYQAK